MRYLVSILAAMVLQMVLQRGFLAKGFSFGTKRLTRRQGVKGLDWLTPLWSMNRDASRASSSSSCSSSAIVPTSQEMKELGRALGRNLREAPAVLFLRGDVGAGKTTLSRGIVDGWGGGRM